MYTLAELSRRADVPVHTLRYWKKCCGKYLQSTASAKTPRYSEKQLEFVLKMKQLVYEQSYTVVGALTAIQRRRTPAVAGSSMSGLVETLESLLTRLG